MAFVYSVNRYSGTLYGARNKDSLPKQVHPSLKDLYRAKVMDNRAYRPPYAANVFNYVLSYSNNLPSLVRAVQTFQLSMVSFC
jgi:hypothetical protein